MASFNVAGFEDVEKMLLKESETVEQVVPEMLKTGAAVLVEAQTAEIKRATRSGRSRGTLANSIKATDVKKRDSSRYIEVYPHGNQPHGTPSKGKKDKVSNAQVGFILEYGRSNMPARPWMSTANEKGAPAANAAMREVWEGRQK